MTEAAFTRALREYGLARSTVHLKARDASHREERIALSDAAEAEVLALYTDAIADRDGLRIVARKLHTVMKQAWEADAFAEWFTDTDNDGVDIPFLIGLLPAIDGPDDVDLPGAQ